jgi:hypothetical protein
MNTTSRPIKPTKIRNAAKSDEEEYRRATFMTTQLYPQIRTSTMRDRIAAFCEDDRLGIGILFISRMLEKSPLSCCSKRARCKAPEILRSEADLAVRGNGEG